MSETTGELAAALAAFQAEMPTVKKAHTAKVPTKAGGSYSYTYAGLADVSESAMPLLAKHGLAFSTCPGLAEGGRFELRGLLLHKSGETLTGSLPIAGATPQEMGSSLTYMRRYLLGCMTGLVTDDDDDGQLAQNAPKRAARAASKPPARRDDDPPPPEGDDISPAQLGKIGALMGELGIKERGEALGYVASVVGHAIESRNDLSKAQASQVIESLAADLDRARA